MERRIQAIRMVADDILYLMQIEFLICLVIVELF